MNPWHEQQIDRDELREAAEAHLRYGGGGDDLANGVLALLNQLDQAEARIKAVQDVHIRGVQGGVEVCVHCDDLGDQLYDGGNWPCATIRALDGER